MCRDKALTLIEIIVVMVIMGIMAGFAIPNMSKVKDKARFSEAVSAVQTLHAAQLRYNLKGTAGAYADDCAKLDVSLNSSSLPSDNMGCSDQGTVSVVADNVAFILVKKVNGSHVVRTFSDTKETYLSLCPQPCSWANIFVGPPPHEMVAEAMEAAETHSMID